MGQMEYGKMIAGCAAALATQTHSLGYVGPLINAETQRLVNATYLGARYCYQTYRQRNPAELIFTVEWIGYWLHIPEVTRDPALVTSQLLDQGADVILSGIDTTEAIRVASQRTSAGLHVWAIPYDYKGACASAPAVCLGVPFFNWGPAYLTQVQLVQQNRWKQEWAWLPPDWKNINNPDTSIVGFEKGAALTPAQAAQLDHFIAGLADGSIVLFRGPLTYQDGSIYLRSNETANDIQIWYMSDLLTGIRSHTR
jgi:simple sugar transport system substrate-binding protein